MNDIYIETEVTMDIESLIPNRDFPDYTAFSESCNPLYFRFALPFLKSKLNEEIPLYADKEHFEELVNESYDLQLEYVERYNPENEFFVTQSSHEATLIDIYFIVRCGEIVMFFTRKSP